MRRDSIFYKISQQFPAILFEMLENLPENAAQYRLTGLLGELPRSIREKIPHYQAIASNP